MTPPALARRVPRCLSSSPTADLSDPGAARRPPPVGAQPHQIAELLLRIATGEVDRLSGRHLSVHDDLDMLLSLTDDVLRDGLYLLRLHGLPTTSLPGSTGTFVNSGPDTPQKTPE
ncbi:MAG: hypothetical protein JWM45_1787 [Pseudonocardiales bacterium]|nr:hypothetical protein [Pseudonocardiales bacterium]